MEALIAINLKKLTASKLDENSIYVPNMQNFGMWAFTSFFEIKYHIFLWSINNLFRMIILQKKKNGLKLDEK
jgi:hypothetical protein